MTLLKMCASVWESKKVHLHMIVYICIGMSACVPCSWRRLCACVTTAWFTVSQLCAETTGHPERKPQRLKLCFPATYNLTLSQRVTWLDPHIGSERGSPSSILSIPISALLFTWSHSCRRSPVWAFFTVAKQRVKELAEAGHGLLLGVKCLVSWHLATED